MKKLTNEEIVKRLRETAEWNDADYPVMQAADMLELYHKIFRSLFPEKSYHYFICGETGEHDSMGLPEEILVCPTYGLDGFQVYTKTGKYEAPGW